jgi:hypothetical protein
VQEILQHGNGTAAAALLALWRVKRKNAQAVGSGRHDAGQRAGRGLQVGHRQAGLADKLRPACGPAITRVQAADNAGLGKLLPLHPVLQAPAAYGQIALISKTIAGFLVCIQGVKRHGGMQPCQHLDRFAHLDQQLQTAG